MSSPETFSHRLLTAEEQLELQELISQKDSLSQESQDRLKTLVQSEYAYQQIVLTSAIIAESKILSDTEKEELLLKLSQFPYSESFQEELKTVLHRLKDEQTERKESIQKELEELENATPPLTESINEGIEDIHTEFRKDLKTDFQNFQKTVDKTAEEIKQKQEGEEIKNIRKSL
jgi:molecular chaperone DnaK (HSP70)